MKVNDIVVLKNGLNSFYLVLEMEKHLFEIVKISEYVAMLKSLSTGVEVNIELESIRLATLKEKYLRDGNLAITYKGTQYIINDDKLSGKNSWINKEDYDDNLNYVGKFNDGTEKNNIYIVAKLDNMLVLDTDLELSFIWQRTPKIELTDDEKVILRSLDDKYKYINRREGGNLLVTSEKGSVFGHSHYINIYNHLFKSITHESGVHEIKELLK